MAGTNAPGSQYFGIAKEATYGTALIPTRLLEVESDTFKREVVNDIREGFRKNQQTTPSDRNRTVMTGAAGTIELPLFFNGMGMLLRSAFKGVPSGKTAWSQISTSPVYQGLYVTDIDGARDSYTFMMARADYDGDLTKSFYYGMVCTKFGVNVSEGEAVKVTFEYAGAGEQTAIPTGSEGAYPTIGSWFHYDDTILTINGKTTIPAKSFSLDCDFGLNSDLRYLTGPGAAARAKPARASIPMYTGTVETNMLDLTMHEAWTKGDMIALELIAENRFTRTINNVLTTFRHEFKITIPEALVTDAAPVSSVSDFTQQSVSFRVMHDVATPTDAVSLVYSSTDSTE